MTAQVIGGLLLSASLVSSPVFAHGDEDPILTKLMVHQLERRWGDEDFNTWNAQLWIGRDARKLWFKTEGEHSNGDVHSGELQALYSQAVTPYWDVQFGIKKDFEPSPSREWLVFALKGLAPYFVETDLSLFVGEAGRTGLRLEAEHEILLSQRWVLIPDLEINAYGKNDPQTETGAGLAKAELGLRLGYHVTRKITPYIGVNWEKKFGNSAEFARDAGEPVSDTQWVAGIKLWF